MERLDGTQYSYVCVNLIFTPTYCCGVRNGVYGCWKADAAIDTEEGERMIAQLMEADGAQITHHSSQQLAKVETVCDETQCCKNDPYDGAQYCWPRTTSELDGTQMAGVSVFGQCNAQCSNDGDDDEDYLSCMTDCENKQQAGNKQSGADTGGWIETPTKPVQIAVTQCDIECRPAHEDDYDSCKADCQEKQQGSTDSLDSTQIAKPPVMIAQPTGNGGMFGGPRAFLDTDDGMSENCSDRCSNDSDHDVCMSDCENHLQGSATPGVMTAFVWTEQCDIQCSGDGIDESDYNECMTNCSENNQSSAPPTIMVAEGGCFVNDQGEETCYGEDGSVIGSAQGTNATTRFASSIRIGDPQPVCDTDAWACFNGTDNESPVIRDVGIFGVFASGDCHHPLGCGY
ncbi:MAG: hypothetical protein ISN28_01235 [Ectothiorhodospiraceae bacterium AqS1]|nr:hypothetical protein [Ectothiorhodospiraceae bacterium AqS1]